MGLVWACPKPFCLFHRFKGQEPSPLWSPELWALEETMMLYSLTLCPTWRWLGAREPPWSSDPGRGGVCVCVPRVGAGFIDL